MKGLENSKQMRRKKEKQSKRRSFCQNRRWLPGRKRVRQSLVFLYPGGDADKELERYYQKKLHYLGVVFLAGVGFALVLLAQSLRSSDLAEERFLKRRTAAYEKELELQIGEEESQEIIISVEPQQMTKEACQDLLRHVKAQMAEYILGENRSFEEVRSDLNLISEIDGTPVTAVWELDSYEIMNLDGSIRRENLKEEGTIVGLTAHLICGEEAAIYQAYAKVLPPILSSEEIFEQELQEQLNQYQLESQERAYQELPQEIQGKRLRWKEKKSWTWLWILGVAFGSVPLLYVAKDQDLKKSLQEREQQMSRDYAQVVSKLVLLMGAGMTTRNAWEQIVRDYQAKREAGKSSVRYVYEEMTLAIHEMQSGVAEGSAYANFGQRCGVPCYLKLAALLEQNLKKGNKGLTALLKVEVQEAFAQRKNLAKIQGEETAAKMMFPMILLLVVVMLLVMIPAAMSMNI